MQPKWDKVFVGLKYFLSSEVMPELSSPAVRKDLLMAIEVIDHLVKRWDTMGSFFINENGDMRQLFKDIIKTLEEGKAKYTSQAFKDLEKDLRRQLKKRYRSKDEYPTIQSLWTENMELKRVLDNTILILEEGRQVHDGKDLAELRRRIRVHLRKHLDAEMAISAPMARTPSGWKA